LLASLRKVLLMQPRPDPRHPVHTQVPHLEAEDKLISLGPLELTLRQAGLLFTGGWVAFILWKACAGLVAWGMVGLALRLLLIALPGLLALAFPVGRDRSWNTRLR
jgi:hypothetical protein